MFTCKLFLPNSVKWFLWPEARKQIVNQKTLWAPSRSRAFSISLPHTMNRVYERLREIADCNVAHNNMRRELIWGSRDVAQMPSFHTECERDATTPSHWLFFGTFSFKVISTMLLGFAPLYPIELWIRHYFYYSHPPRTTYTQSRWDRYWSGEIPGVSYACAIEVIKIKYSTEKSAPGWVLTVL